MLVNLLYKRNFFIHIFIIVLFMGLGMINFNTIVLSDLEKLGFFLTFLTVIFVVYIDFKNDLLNSSSFPIFTYILFLMPFIAGLTDYKIAGSLLLITYVSAKLLYFESEKNDIYEAFDIGLFMSFAILLSPPLIFLGIIIFAYFLTLRVVEPKIPILGFLGFIVPILVIVQISYLLDYYFLLEFYKEQLIPRLFQFELKQIFLIPIGIILIFSIIHQIKTGNKLSAQKKRIYLFIHLMFFTLLISYIFFWNSNDTYLSFLSFCVMIMLTRYFSEYRPKITWLNEAYVWIYLICLLIFNFYDRIPKFFTLITDVSF
ncbi:DUF6427 family protein [Chishuiella sp.]|uniref:DUF6427 family protein n=1 Tax=Chishuiella sp. TaxID=1969467 RepID=UPI0028A77A6E|nr:DUF6427 family protein [Chishuiella sp.]